MTNSVSSTRAAGAIAAAVRAATSGQLQPGSAKRRTNETSRKPARDAKLASLIAQRVQALNVDEPDYARRLMRVVVEASLVQEFGAELVTSPRFQEVVDQVARDLCAVPQLTAAIDLVVAAFGGKVHPLKG